METSLVPHLLRVFRLSIGIVVLSSGLWAFAGGGPCNYIVLYDQADTNSVAVANYYQQVRGIPERNMVPYTFFPAGKTAYSKSDLWNLTLYLRQVIQDRGLTGRFNGIAVAGTVPLLGSSDQLGFQTGLYFSPGFSGSAAFNSYYANLAYALPPGQPTREIRDDKPYNSTNVYWPVSFVGFTGVNGNTPDEVFALIDRSKVADGLQPDGMVYWPTNSDIRSISREDQVAVVDPVWQERGINYLVTGPSIMFEEGRPDIVGEIVGSTYAEQGVSGNTYLPGAWVDSYTSCGGQLNRFGGGGQSSAGAWLRAGAYGSSGASAEPYAFQPQKFPHAHIHTHLRAGASLAEAFWQSLEEPQEIVCLGDPLLQAWAQIPQVTITSPTDGAVLSSVAGINAAASTASPDGLESQYELAIDGHIVRIGDSNETVSATWTGSGFTLNTATLADGWHDLRVIAYNNNDIHTQGEARRTIFVNNSGQSIALTGPAALEYTGNGTFTVALTSIANATNVTIQANGRTLAALSTSGGSTNISASLFGYQGQTKLYALAWLNNGKQVWSAPLDVSLSWAPVAATNVTPGSAVAQVRYFSTTTATNFDWDSAAPDGVTNYPGPVLSEGWDTAVKYRSFVITTNYLPAFVPGDFTGKPGFDSTMYFLAPTNGLYEFVANAVSATNIIIDVDGQSVQYGTSSSDGNIKPSPVKLAAGFHPVRLRFQVTAANYSMELWYRGGPTPGNYNGRHSNYQFLRLNELVCFGPAVTGNAAPVITTDPVGTSVSNSPTKMLLSAGATDPDGSTNALTYSWAKIDGPGRMTLVTNATSTCFTNLATFTRAGNYRLRVMVSDGLSVATGEVTTVVTSAYSTVSLWPASVTMLTGASAQFSAVQKDQFGTGFTNRSLTWLVLGDGTVTSNGLYTAPLTTGTNQVVVTDGKYGATNTIIVISSSTPIARFNASPSFGWIPLEVSFTDTSSGDITNRFWDFGDGTVTNTTATSVTHTYTSEGNRTVQLVVSGPDGVSTNTQVDCVQAATAVAPFADFMVSTNSGTAPLTVDFFDASTGDVTNQFWDFGDGFTTNTLAATVSHTYNGAGTNTVRLISSGSAGVSTNTQVAAVTVTLPAAPSAGFSASPLSGAAPLAVSFTDTSTGSITNRFWSFGDGAATNTTATSVSHTYTVAGTNTVRLIVSGPGGSSTNTQADLISVAAASIGNLLVYDPFNDAPTAATASSNTIPSGWFSDSVSNAGTLHGTVASGSLNYSEFATSQGNSFGLGNKTSDYYLDFTSPNLAVDQTVYFSLLLCLNSATPSVMNSGAIRLFDGADLYGSGIEVSFGVTNLGGAMSFSLNNRNRVWNDALTLTKTPVSYTATGVTYLIVGSYTRGSAAANGLTQLWINPDSASFGTAAPPAATLSTNTYASDSAWNRLQIISSGSSSWPTNWQIDEVRVGTNWAGVVPAAILAPSGDADSDGIPDDWETQYFGNSTSANHSALAANGVNTIYEIYIAGLNPTNPASRLSLAVQQAASQRLLQWSAVSGRVYSVYWTTNLLNGFQPLATNIFWPQNSWTGQVNGSRGGFYKLEVQLE